MPEEILLDVYDLEPPEPYERATAALADLQPGQYLKLIIPRRPRLLYPWLAQHGFMEYTQEATPDQYLVYIWHTDDHVCTETIADLLST